MKLQTLFEVTETAGEKWNKPNLIGYSDFVYVTRNAQQRIRRFPVKDDFDKGKYVANRTGISSWEGIPKICNFSVLVAENRLNNFDHAPEKIVGNLTLSNNLFTSLSGINKHIKEIHGFLNITGNPIESSMLGIMKIKGLTEIIFTDRKEIETIFNRHLQSGDIIECQSELMDAGLEEYAKL